MFNGCPQTFIPGIFNHYNNAISSITKLWNDLSTSTTRRRKRITKISNRKKEWGVIIIYAIKIYELHNIPANQLLVSRASPFAWRSWLTRLISYIIYFYNLFLNNITLSCKKQNKDNSWCKVMQNLVMLHIWYSRKNSYGFDSFFTLTDSISDCYSFCTCR